jgi:hypothetical protein
MPPELLATGRGLNIIFAMKFLLAFLLFVVFALLISWGIVLMMHGTPWIFIASLVLFLGLFVKYGCLTSHE